MAKAVLVTCLLALSIGSASAYARDCAIGPEYWCKSLEIAEDCGALRHCTDTVWRFDTGLDTNDASTTCEWCQKIVQNTHKGIQHLANNDDLIKSSLINGCKLFPLVSVSSECTAKVEKYGKPIVSLMQAKRYATVCQLMNICSSKTPEKETTTSTEKPIVLGIKRCTWGPSYWCSSLSNAHECGSIEHCSTKVWSQQSIEKKSNDNICQYCEFTIEKLRVIIQDNRTEINIEKWLTGACSMLPQKDLIDECVSMMGIYADQILTMIKTNIDPGVICHLTHMCKDTTIITRIVTNDEKAIHDEIEAKIDSSSDDEQTKMLCNVVVRATHELYFNQKKNRDETQAFLKDDCQHLSTSELREKCDQLVVKHGVEIFGHVASKVDLSRVCGYIHGFGEEFTVKSVPSVHCEVCSFVLATAKYMLDAKHAEETVLQYIDEQVCARLTGTAQNSCRKMVQTKGKDLLDSIKCGTRPMLICAHFQVCLDQILDKTSPIQKVEMKAFLKNEICENLGRFKDACEALLEKDATRLLNVLANGVDGNDLCQLFGLCPKKMTFLDNLAVNDDKNKCKRCVDDFTRRKHIAEKLVNHSSEFLHHLCGQLPQKDECTKTVDESINELVQFIRSMDPQDICVQLKMCNASLLPTIRGIPAWESSIDQDIIAYINTEICPKSDALAPLCIKLMNEEGPAILAFIGKEINPEKACETIGVCPGKSTFENCADKCECCMDKIEVHEVQAATFLRSMVDSMRSMCKRMPSSDKCLEKAKNFQLDVDKITTRFDAKRACELLTFCPAHPIEIETLPQCVSRMESKKQFLLESISSINQNLKTLCEYVPWNKDCQSVIDRSTLDVSDRVSKLNSQTICASGESLVDLICHSGSPFETLCKQLVKFDESNRMEALFKSILNQNGRIEKAICELDNEQISDCHPSVKKVDNCKDKCDCCVQFYTTKKNYDLQMIETLRSGFLASCDWSLTKDYCVAWFNRVCDRMKAKVDQFQPTNVCKRIGACPIEQQKSLSNDECKPNEDKCQCCTSRIDSRQKRFSSIMKEVTNALLSVCTEEECRSLVRSAQQNSLDKIEKINSQTLCKRMGYCTPAQSHDPSPFLGRLMLQAHQHQGSSLEALSDRLQTALSSEICFEFGQMQPLCEHLIASSESRRYAHIYMALIKKDSKMIDDDFREQLASKVGDVCDGCKNAVQASKDFWLNGLETVRASLIRSCERCPQKDQCIDWYNQKFDYIKSYLNNIDPEQWCQSIHLCPTTHIIVIKTDNKCSTCVSRLQSRKDGLLRAVDRVESYFDDICKRYAGEQCQTFVQQIAQAAREQLNKFDPKQTCTAIGFCADTNMDFDLYERQLETELDKTICSKLGPFEALCKQVIQGNVKQIQTLKINYNIKDLMKIGELFNSNDASKNFFTARNLNECNGDKCKCCIDTLDAKKKCAKTMGDNIIAVFSRSCDYCPAKDQCRQYWTNAQKCIDECIDQINSKQVCTQLGFCNASTLCANMGVFRESCEQALNAFTHGIQHDKQTLENHLPHTSVVLLPNKPVEVEKKIDDSNSTCILCEFMMNILSNYVHKKSTEAEIEQSLQKVCDGMPTTLKKQCHELVDNYGPVIIATLLSEFDVTTVCHKLNLCTSQMHVTTTHLTKANTASCGICDYVSTYIHFALERDSSDKALQQALKTVCTHLSNEHMTKCQTLVNLFAPTIRQLQLNTGNNFCKQLAICQTPMVDLQPATNLVRVPLTHVQKPIENVDNLKNTIVNNIDATPQCTLCHYVISYLDAVLKNNKSEAAIEDALDKVCSILPKKERDQCDEFVKAYGPVIAQLIAEAADPDMICRYLGMCQVVLPQDSTTKKPTSVTYPNHDYVHLPAKTSPFTCTICQFVVSRMKHNLALNQTEEEIVASLKDSCSLFTALDLKQQCLDFLDKYAPYLVQMVSNDIEPKVVCQSLSLCPKKVQASTIISSLNVAPKVSPSSTYGKCIYGISYWCTSRQNAELCNAVEICQRQVWSKQHKNIVI